MIGSLRAAARLSRTAGQQARRFSSGVSVEEEVKVGPMSCSKLFGLGLGPGRRR